MTVRSQSGILPPVVAALVTLVFTWLQGTASGGPEVAPELVGILIVFLMPVPLVVSAIWGTAFLAARSPRLVGLVAGAWLVLSLALLPKDLVWPMASFILAGVAAGWALASRIRLDWSLGLVVVVLLPILIWSDLQFPLEVQLEEGIDMVLTARREMLEGTAAERQIELSLAEERQRLQAYADTVMKTAIASRILGYLGLSGVILALVYWLSRRLGVAPRFRSLPRFTHWQLPFYLVWILVGGIALVLVRQPMLVNLGLNLMAAVLVIISIQGIAVQGFVANSFMSRPMLVMYWVVMTIVLTPLLLASGALLGLADYWLDIRRLNVPVESEQDEDNGGSDDGPGV